VIVNTSHSRLYYLDNLRAILMIAGVFFHAALAYSPMVHSLWLTADKVNVPWVDYLCNFLHTFRMPIFFVVAGFFAALLVERRGVGAMLKNRCRRILLPFVVFVPLVLLGIMFPVGWALDNIQNLSPLLQFIKKMKDLSDAPKFPPSSVHLWFLYYLMFFYVLIWVARLLVPARLKTKLLALNPTVALLVLPLFLLPGLSMVTVPYGAPESFIPQLWAFAYFGLFFAYGYLLFGAYGLVDKFQTTWPWLVAASVMLFVPFQMLMPKQITFEYQVPDWSTRIVMMLCLAYISVFMSIAGLAFAKQVLDVRHGAMRFLADASYWIYIAHLPLLFAIQYWLLDQPFGLGYKYAVSVGATLFICVVSYVLFVRWTPIGWMLNGRHRFR
jgi:glucans biosynthesis protein C